MLQDERGEGQRENCSDHVRSGTRRAPRLAPPVRTPTTPSRELADASAAGEDRGCPDHFDGQLIRKRLWGRNALMRQEISSNFHRSWPGVRAGPDFACVSLPAGQVRAAADGRSMMRRSWLAVAAAAVAVALVAGSEVRGASANRRAAAAGPTFKVDATWPQEFPNHWVMGSVTGVFVDAKDHVWITHLPETLTEEELYEEQTPPMATCCKAAPTVIELDQNGKVVQGWGEQGQGRPGELAAQPARHLRRPQRLRVGRHAHAPPRDEVHARGQAGADDRPVRQERRQQRHDAARRPVGHLGRSEDQRGVHLRRLPQPPRDRVRRRDRRLQAPLGRLRQPARRHREVRSEDDGGRARCRSSSRRRTASPDRPTARSTSPIAAATASRCSSSRASS